MRDVLLAEVTLKIKKTWHIKWQLKSVKFGGFFFLFVIINFNCSITVCIPLALLEMRHSECEMVSTRSFFSAQGDRKGPSLVYKLTLTRSVLSWMSSPSQCSECYCTMSTPRCHDYTLRQMRQTASPSAPRKAPRCPLSVTFLLGAISQRASQCSFNGSKSTWALYPCPRIKRPLLPPFCPLQPSASCHQVSLATVAAATALITASWFGLWMLNRREQAV